MTQKYALMIQGCGSDSCKSMIVAGLCRLFARRGFKIAPFKAQNMSNNAAVVANGGEIGRAQALQAKACNIEASVDMNPVLLKPEAGYKSQLIVQGKRIGVMRAHMFRQERQKLMKSVLESYHRLLEQYDFIIVEGAGSPAEINLREGDIANMGFANAVQIPVLLVGDIDRGGVIAQIVGTREVLSAQDQKYLKGYIINKFKGDPALFEDAIDFINKTTGFEHFGTLGWFNHLSFLPAEDSLTLDQQNRQKSNLDTRDKKQNGNHQKLKIAILRLPHIANFDDFDALANLQDCIDLVWIYPSYSIPGDCDWVIIPGSKSTINDLKTLYQEGWDIDLLAHHRRGGCILGICGGYQMLGETIIDLQQVESDQKHVSALNLIAVKTQMQPSKILQKNRVRLSELDQWVEAYQIHIGKTQKQQPTLRAFAKTEQGEDDGAISSDNKVFGTYLHGFLNDRAGQAMLWHYAGWPKAPMHHLQNWEQMVDKILDQWADQLEKQMPIDRIIQLAKQPVKGSKSSKNR
ncbi:MAG: cobyric acid synthase [Pseudomonadota bacterium]